MRVNEPALFNPAGRLFTRVSRLTIRAEVLPDDPGWSRQNMPVPIHTMALLPNWMGRPDPFGGVNYGMQFETSHVTVLCAIADNIVSAALLGCPVEVPVGGLDQPRIRVNALSAVESV
jgi:hypothetical protein